MTRRRVVVTGMGIVSPVGSDLKTAWDSILAGKSGIGPITTYDVSAYTTRFAGLVQGLKLEDWMGPKEIKKTDPFIHYGVAAAKQAVRDAGLEITDANRSRIGVCVGSGIGGIGTIEDECRKLHAKGPGRVSPFFVPSSIINMVSGHITIDLGITGASFATVSACTTAAHAIGVGARLIQAGDAEVFIAGGSEAGSAPAGMAGFCQARALSTRNEAPQQASRPWDKDRDGFVLGDGGGVLVLEDYDYARQRGARVYAELVGFGMSSDAYHITLPVEGGVGGASSMRNALKDAGLAPEQVGYINAHGTSTPAGDLAETQGIKACFGEVAYRIPVSSTKSMTGHLLGGAGGLEGGITVLALMNQTLPPTVNLEDQDPDTAGMDFVPNQPRKANFEYALSNSFGFGGTNGSLLFRRWSE
jgi:3-oxoacyl-[acyl-carrier-protein] synthase II